MAVQDFERDRAAQLAWDRRQGAALSQGRNTLSKAPSRGQGSQSTEQQLREQGGAQLGRSVGAAAGSVVPIIGTAIGAFFGGLFGKKVGGSVIGKIVVVGIMIGMVVGLILLCIVTLFTFCNEYSFTLRAGSVVNDEAATLYGLCKSFTQ